MKKTKPNKAGERGITLIALIVMILIVIILSAITIKGVLGDHSIIDVSADIAQDADNKETTTRTCTTTGCVNGYITISYNCSAHGYRYSHYYCSRHGNSVSQYHG